MLFLSESEYCVQQFYPFDSILVLIEAPSQVTALSKIESTYCWMNQITVYIYSANLKILAHHLWGYLLW
jgi:hypothetical protein